MRSRVMWIWKFSSIIQNIFVELKDFDRIGSAFSLEIRPVRELKIPSLHIRPTPVGSGGPKIFI